MNNIAHLDTAVLYTAAKFFRTMQKAGADFTGPMRHLTQRRNLVAYLKMGCPKVDNDGKIIAPDWLWPEGEDLCRLILGDDFLSPKDVGEAYGLSYSDDQTMNFTKTMPDTETVLWLRHNGYMLVATPPSDMNLLQVRDLDNPLFYPKSEGCLAHPSSPQQFCREDKVTKIKAGQWLMARKEPYPNSHGKTWDDQKDLLQEVERVPNAAEVAYVVITYSAVRGVVLMQGVYVRTSSVSAAGYRAFVGGFDDAGLRIGCDQSDNRDDNIGVSSSRK